MALVRKSLSQWITGAIVLTLGILIIVMGASKDAQTSGDSADAISVILGVISIIVGSLALVLAILSGVLSKRSFAVSGIAAGITLALGISLCVGKYAASLIGLFLYIIPFLLIVLGAVILADGIYTLVVAILGKGKLVAQIVSIIVGTTALVLGCLCVGNNPVIPQNAQLITFGIIVVVYAVLIILGTFFTLPTVVVVAKEEK